MCTTLSKPAIADLILGPQSSRGGTANLVKVLWIPNGHGRDEFMKRKTVADISFKYLSAIAWLSKQGHFVEFGPVSAWRSRVILRMEAIEALRDW